NRRDELILVVEVARIQDQIAGALGFMLERSGELPALVRVELRIAHAIRNAVKAADAAVPALADLEAVEAVGAIKVLVAQRYPQTPRRLVRTCLEQIVGRGTDLPACEHDRRAALQDLDRANGVV